MLMKELNSIDSERFSSTPAFGADGKCRLKFEGASACTWPMLLDASPGAFECLQLGFTVIAG